MQGDRDGLRRACANRAVRPVNDPGDEKPVTASDEHGPSRVADAGSVFSGPHLDALSTDGNDLGIDATKNTRVPGKRARPTVACERYRAVDDQAPVGKGRHARLRWNEETAKTYVVDRIAGLVARMGVALPSSGVGFADADLDATDAEAMSAPEFPFLTSLNLRTEAQPAASLVSWKREPEA